MESDPDLPLVDRCLAGDRAALEALVRRYERPLYNAAYRVLGDADDAADTTQTVFVRMWEKLDTFDRQYRFFSWIYRIAVNEALNVLRRKGREEPLGEDEEGFAPESADPAWQYEEAEASRRLHEALRRTSAQDRVVLTLRHFSEASYEDMAEILGVETKTVKSRLFEARRRLREQLRNLQGT